MYDAACADVPSETMSLGIRRVRCKGAPTSRLSSSNGASLASNLPSGVVKAADVEAAAHFGVDPAVTHHLYKWPRSKGGKARRHSRQLESRESHGSRTSKSSRNLMRKPTRMLKKASRRLDTHEGSEEGEEESEEEAEAEEKASSASGSDNGEEKAEEPLRVGMLVKLAEFSKSSGASFDPDPLPTNDALSGEQQRAVRLPGLCALRFDRRGAACSLRLVLRTNRAACPHPAGNDIMHNSSLPKPNPNP